MAITAAAIAGFLTPILQDLSKKAVGKVVTTIMEKGGAEFKEKITQKLLEKELDKYLTEEDVDKFIEKYSEAINDQVASRIRSIAELRDSFYKVEQILKEKIYSEDSAKEFIKLAGKIQVVSTIVPFASAGITLKVKDAETGEELEVKDEHYTIALLLRYAAAAYTQIAYKNTPELEGINLSYDSDVKVRFRRPRFLRNLSDLGKDKEISYDYSSFKSAYESFMQIYTEADAIANLYLKAVSCLKSAALLLEKVSNEQAKHKTMTVEQMKGLSICFRGEAQYWLLKISDKIDTIYEAVLKESGGDSTKIKTKVKEEFEATEEDIVMFEQALTIYGEIPAGVKGAKSMLERGVAKLESGKEKEKFTQRLEQARKEAGGKEEKIIVDEPKPIF